MGVLLDSVVKTSNQIKDGVHGLWNDAAKQRALDSVPPTVTRNPSALGAAAKAPFKAAFNGGLYVASRPFAWTRDLAAAGVRGTGNLYARAPIPALLLTAGGAVLAVAGLVNRGERRRGEQQYAQLQAIASAQQPQMAYGLQPGEYSAMVEPRLKEGGIVNGLAERQAAAAAAPAGPPV